MNQAGRALIAEDGRTAPDRSSEAFAAMNFEAAKAGGGREALPGFAPNRYDIALEATAGARLDGTGLLESGMIDQEGQSPGKGFLLGGVISLSMWIVLGVLLANLLS